MRERMLGIFINVTVGEEEVEEEEGWVFGVERSGFYILSWVPLILHKWWDEVFRGWLCECVCLW